MRSMWKGSVSFGMVNIPVKMYKATESGSDIALCNVHHECGTAVQMPKYCPKCQRILEASELEKAYPLDRKKEKCLPISNEELASIPLKSVHTLEIDGFIREIPDVRFYDSVYILEPEDLGHRAFALFEKAMGQVGVLGVGKITTASREHLCVIKPTGDGLMYIITMNWAEDIRSTQELKRPTVAVSEKELTMAKMLISTLPQEVDLNTYTDEYSAALKKLIDAKMDGKTIEAVAPVAPTKEFDLEALLAQSLQMAGSK